MEVDKLQMPKNETKTVFVGSVPFGGPQFQVIAGPCSIESPAQFLETARAVKNQGASMLRGGIWKLRTSAESFQGLGHHALDFIKETCADVGLGLVSEVTDPRQIEQIYDVVSMFQVGSRNMHNYALLKELGQQGKPVLLKRGFAALIDEWIKAADYIVRGGNSNVILCERGIRTFETATRNTLDLNAVVYAKKNSSFPVIVDPSHAVGIRELVAPLAYASAAAGADGLIVEVHPRPSEALSDGMQALTFQDFAQMMSQLKLLTKAMGREVEFGNKFEIRN
ncbi:MAG TPA: 3-deoxy-7-phosphoheptulonate synthase [Pseudobdellovibrionaceae bacterium]|nr:3-deoxy-7-phosphoheptulonate synthase [Pseudobdellovibrionaceae bacterium]